MKPAVVQELISAFRPSPVVNQMAFSEGKRRLAWRKQELAEATVQELSKPCQRYPLAYSMHFRVDPR